jgi:predicted permease
MAVIPGIRRLFRLATGRPTAEADLQDELGLHVDLLTEELIAAGMDPDVARREAERRFGNREAIGRFVRSIDRGAHRDRRRRESLRQARQDVWVAVRTLVRQPFFALGGVTLVALGVGAATAMFAVLNAAFFRPFGYPEADRLTYVWEVTDNGHRMRVAGPNAADWSRETRLFSALAYFGTDQAILTGDGEPEYVQAAYVSRPFAPALGVVPLTGRWFSAEEARAGGPPVAVLSEGLWRRRFGGDPSLVGRPIRLSGALVTIVGVMPRGLGLPVGATVWLPAEPHNDGTSRTAHNWQVIARLAPGVEPAAAERELSALTRRLVADETGGRDFIAASAALVSLRDQLVGGESRKVLLLLQGAVLLVLLIAAVNLTSLTLARAVRRRGEMGVCLALGAQRVDVIRRFATENLLLTLSGGALGLLLAALLRGLLLRWVSRMLPFVEALPLDGRVAAFAIGLAVLVGLGSALVPAWRVSRTAATPVASRGGTPPRESHRLINGLMAAEVALAVVLVAGAGLVVKSLWRLSAVDPGFAVAGRAVALVPLHTGQGSITPTKESLAAAYDRILTELRARPGTILVAATSALPLWGDSPNGSAQIEGTPSAAGGPPAVSDFRVASPDYFRTMEIPVRQGREFQETDTPGSTYAAVVNEAFVRRYLDGGVALGRRVRFPGMDSDEDPWATIIGVVGDTRQDGLAVEPVPAIYYTYRQRPYDTPMTIVVRSTLPPTPVLADMRAAIAGVDRGIPFVGRSLNEVVQRSLALPRIRSILLALFAAIALLLAAAGIGAVVAFAVAQRTREIGLRIAVGAPPAAITREGVRRAAGPVLVGLIVGVLGALGLGRVLRGLLFEMAPGDPATLLGAGAFTLGVALLAAYIPARRARRVDPLTALRAE